MNLHEYSVIDSGRKQVARCLGAALLRFFVLDLICTVILHLLWLASMAMFPLLVVFWYSYDGIKLVMNLFKFILPIRYYLSAMGIRWTDIRRPRENGEIYRVERWSKPSKVLFFIFAAAITVAVTNFVAAVTEEICYQLGVTGFGRELIPTPVSAILFFVATVIATPILEETLFRGVTMKALAPYGMKWTVLGSGALFALMHGTVYQLCYAFLAGCCIAFFAYVSNSLRVAIGLHFVNNLMSFAVIFARDWFDDAMYAQQLTTVFELVTVPLAIAGAVYFIVRKVWRTVPADGDEEDKMPPCGQNCDDGGGECEVPIGRESIDDGSPICREIILYAVFAFISCFF